MKLDEFKMKIGDIVRTPTSVGVVYDIMVSQRTGHIQVDVISVKNVFKEQGADPFSGNMINSLKPATISDLIAELDRRCKEGGAGAAALFDYADRYYGRRFDTITGKDSTYPQAAAAPKT